MLVNKNVCWRKACKTFTNMQLPERRDVGENYVPEYVWNFWYFTKIQKSFHQHKFKILSSPTYIYFFHRHISRTSLQPTMWLLEAVCARLNPKMCMSRFNGHSLVRTWSVGEVIIRDHWSPYLQNPYLNLTVEPVVHNKYRYFIFHSKCSSNPLSNISFLVVQINRLIRQGWKCKVGCSLKSVKTYWRYGWYHMSHMVWAIYNYPHYKSRTECAKRFNRRLKLKISVAWSLFLIFFSRFVAFHRNLLRYNN